MPYTEIKRCRISDSENLVSILDLGNQALTGVFPKEESEIVESGPVELVWCPDSNLVQLKHSFDPDQMYGENYGYRSGLNSSMVTHLEKKVVLLESQYPLNDNDVVLDIGSNDATTLKAYKKGNVHKIGIDPTGGKFLEFYDKNIDLVVDFFSATAYQTVTNRKAKIVTSIAMFYDLEDPVKFAGDICEILDDDGVWHFEQSYLPSMLHTNSYDTICQEHLEYYSIASIENILEQVGMKIIDVTLNDINGGSFAVTAAKEGSSKHTTPSVEAKWLREQELRIGLNSIEPYLEFAKRVEQHKEDLNRLLEGLKQSGKTILGYGASTKGNVMLQYCGITSDLMPAVVEVNPDKFGSYTPGTKIPIISEQEARDLNPDYFLVLPWHFKNNILPRETSYMMNGGKFIFPFPHISVI